MGRSSPTTRCGALRRQRVSRRPNWNGCAARSVDVQVAITELRTGQQFTGTHHETFPMRPEQAEAVEQDACLLPLDLEGGHARGPALPLEREDALRQDVHHLPARQEARRNQGARGDLQASGRGCVAARPGVPCRLRRAGSTSRGERHGPHEGRPRSSPWSTSARSRTCWARTRPATSRPRTRGCTRPTGTWSSSTSTTSGRGATTPRSCSRARTTPRPRRSCRRSSTPNLEGFNEDLDELGEAETEFLPITTKAYLYLSGTPFKALATGEFIEEQIFNWTYTDEQRAKQELGRTHPGPATRTPRCRRCGCSPTRCPTS